MKSHLHLDTYLFYIFYDIYIHTSIKQNSPSICQISELTVRDQWVKMFAHRCVRETDRQTGGQGIYLASLWLGWGWRGPGEPFPAVWTARRGLPQNQLKQQPQITVTLLRGRPHMEQQHRRGHQKLGALRFLPHVCETTTMKWLWF